MLLLPMLMIVIVVNRSNAVAADVDDCNRGEQV